jgi:ubiquinone/menaquinone biosynthesis C-methylase UbiE
MTRDTAGDEANRIRAVYERRAASGRERRYSLFEPGHLFHSQSLERALVRALRREGLASLQGLRVLDVGCGGGSWLAGLTRFGAEPAKLVGVDLRPPALPSDPSGLNLAVASGDRLPFASESFDVVCQLTMLSSVLDRNMRTAIAGEMLRVLKPSGILLCYDFTVNPFNPDVAGVRRAELDQLFPSTRIRADRVTLAPPITRLIAPRSWLLCELLEGVPWLRTHLLASIRSAAHAPNSLA